MGQRRLGFTLIELLIAVTIFSVIAVALYSCFNAGIRVWRRAEENMELHQSVRLTLEGLAKELRNAVNYADEDAGEEPQEEEEVEEGELEEGEGLLEKPDLVFFGSKDELRFVTLVTRLLEEGKFRKELAKLNYSLSGGEGELGREIAFQSEGFNPAGEAKETLISGIEELSFKYSYEPEEEDSPVEWKDYWENQKDVPLGVRIYLKVKREEGGTSEFSKIVFIPTGILGKEEESAEE